MGFSRPALFTRSGRVGGHSFNFLTSNHSNHWEISEQNVQSKARRLPPKMYESLHLTLHLNSTLKIKLSALTCIYMNMLCLMTCLNWFKILFFFFFYFSCCIIVYMCLISVRLPQCLWRSWKIRRSGMGTLLFSPALWRDNRDRRSPGPGMVSRYWTIRWASLLPQHVVVCAM